MVKVDYITNTIYNSRTYILYDNSNNVWLVDCGDIDKVIEKIGSKHVIGVLLTHTHSDHIYGLKDLFIKFPNSIVYTNDYGYEALASPRLNISKYHSEFDDIAIVDRRNIRKLNASSELSILGETVEILETPGHDPSCLTYRIQNYLFTGDSYIPGIKVVTSFPHSDKNKAIASVKIIRDVSNVIILPGHEI